MRPQSLRSRLRAERRQRFFRPATEQLEDRRLLTGTVTGRIWLDLDQDGFQDNTETQNRDVTIRLEQHGNVLAQQTTNNGLYSFNNVPHDQNVYLRFVMPDGHTLGPKNVFGLDPSLDNDFSNFDNPQTNQLEGETFWFQVANGQTIERDAGLIPGATLEIFCWNDVDVDGVQEGEAGLEGVTLYLYKDGSIFKSLQSSGPNGISKTENLPPGTYTIHADPPENTNFAFTLQNQGNDNLDSDVNSNGNSDPFTLQVGVTQTSVDVGLRDTTVNTGSIAGHAWLDDGDGIKENGENTLTGVHNFSVYSSENNIVGDGDDFFVDSAGTDPNTQNYLVDGLTPGKYYVKVTVPESHILTLQNQGNNDPIDSDFDRTVFNSHMVTVTTGNTVNDIDAGFLPGGGKIGDLVWLDADRDGLKDANESPLAGVDVRLFTSTGTMVGDLITTQADGKYLFSGLQPGSYFVRFEPPLQYLPTLRDQGTNDNIDSDMIPNSLVTSWRTPIIALAAGESELNWDAGFVLGAQVGDRVWIDANRNGRQDDGEPGKVGVIVKLKQAGADGNLGTADDVVVKTTGTDNEGKYLFQGVENGSYYVEFVRPTGFVFTRRNIGDDLGDSDPGLSNGRTARFTIANYANNLTLDAGLVPGARLNTRVIVDNNCDGTIDGRRGGVTIMVINPVNGIVGDHDDIVVRTGVSNSNGNFSFLDLPAGKYVLRADLPQGWHFITPGVNSDIDQLCGGWGYTSIFVINPGGSTTIDVGLCPEEGAIEGFVWNDANGNTVRDGGLIKGPKPEIIFVIDVSGGTGLQVPGTNVGDVNGDGFGNTILDVQIQGAINVVNELIAAGYNSSNTQVGIVAYQSSARAVDMHLDPNTTQVSIPIGFNFDNDSTLDVIEVLKKLRSGGGTNHEAALREVLDSLFITENMDENVLFFSGSTRTNGGSITDEVASLRSKDLNLRAFGLKPASKQELTEIDPGAQVYEMGADFLAALRLNNVSGFASERGMAGVTVYLDLNGDGVWNSNTEPRAVTRTDDPDTSDIDETGHYRFDELLPGTYTVREVVPTGYTQTYPGANTFKHVISLAAGETESNVDFGNAANPVISGVPGSVTYTGAGTQFGVYLAQSVTISDVDTALFSGGRLEVRTAVNAQSTDRIFIGDAGQVTTALDGEVRYGGAKVGTYSGGSGSQALVIAFNGNATRAIVQAVARCIAFYNSDANTPTTARSVRWLLKDGHGGTSSVVQQTVNLG